MSIPKPRLSPSLPPMLWNTRSTGAPRSIASMVCRTCASTHDCVGMPWCSMSSASTSEMRMIGVTPSVAGFTPITASPAPSSNPSMVLAKMPATSSAGWLGWIRVANRPGSPRVERNAVTTLRLRATAMRS